MAKMKKTSTRIDMTAMCDVSFLLLTFFVLTSTAKIPEVHPVDIPLSTQEEKIPTDDIITLSIGDDNVFVGISGKEDKKDILKRMGVEYNIEFTDAELNAFVGLQDFGVDIKDMKTLLNQPAKDRMKTEFHKGIPYKDSTNNQLSTWVKCARESSWELKESYKKVAIKGDSEENYGVVKEIIDILQKQRQNSFYLVTGLRDENF